MKLKKIVALAVVLGIALTPAAAYGAETPPPEDPTPQLSQEVQEQLATIPESELKEITKQVIADTLADGGEVLGVDYAPFVPDGSAARGDVGAMALPAGCGSTATASRTGLWVYNVLSTSCATSWQSIVFRQRIVYTNPYNPYDYGTLVDTSTTYGSGSYRARTISFNCKNTNETHYSMYGRNTAVFGGVPYTAEVGDFLTSVPCGK